MHSSTQHQPDPLMSICSSARACSLDLKEPPDYTPSLAIRKTLLQPIQILIPAVVHLLVARRKKLQGN
jgi:hypothetical protein